MKKNTIIRCLSRSKFIKRHILLTLISVIIYFSLSYELPVVIYMLLAIFSPWILIVYEAIIIVGRLHDMNKSIVLLAFLYLKVTLYLAFLTSNITYREVLFVIAYLLFIASLCTKKSAIENKADAISSQ